MAETKEKPLLLKQHRRLLNIATAANVFVWIVSILTILGVLGTYQQALTAYNLGNGHAPRTIWAAFGSDLASVSKFLLDVADTAVWGIALALVLKGISLALNMIVETDLNYRLAAKGESHE